MGFKKRKYYVKYMLSPRCKEIVKSELEKLNVPFMLLIFNAIEFHEGLSDKKYSELKTNLSKTGISILGENESFIIEKIINDIIETVHYSDHLPRVSYFDIIDENIISDTEAVLKIFSDVQGMSVLNFIVNQKIERAKELLLYDDISIVEISEILNYKNEHYFVAQFRKVTGLTPSYFLKLKQKRLLIAEKAKRISQI